MSLYARVALERGAFSLDVELCLEPGRTVALIGPNGSGKSTLVEALAGLLPIARGEIALDGRALECPDKGVRLAPQDRPVGVLFQGLWLFPHLSVVDNVAYGLWARGERRPRARARVAPLLERLDLTDLAERRPDALSGGEAQRVALARALAPQPRLLLLDEPLSALDLESRPRTRAFLQEALTEFAGPRLVITHDPLEALLLADHLVVLEEGRVVQSGATQDVRSHPRTRYVATLAGVNLLEEDPAVRSVGYGGLPNEDGVVELDSCVMHGPTHNAGAVAALRDTKYATRVARLVMDRTDHVLLVGDGALKFARAHGHGRDESL